MASDWQKLHFDFDFSTSFVVVRVSLWHFWHCMNSFLEFCQFPFRRISGSVVYDTGMNYAQLIGILCRRIESFSDQLLVAGIGLPGA